MNAIFGKVLGEVTAEDLNLRAMTPLAVKAPAIKQVRDVHHKIAQMLASGLKEGEVAAAMGYAVSRISILKDDPSFQELLEFYREPFKKARLQDVERLAMVSRTAVEELQQRLMDSPELISEKMLVEIVKMGADRSGLGPTTKSVSLSAALTAADIAALKGASSDNGVTIISSEDREARARLVDRRESLDSSEQERTEEGGPQERDSVREESSQGTPAVEPNSSPGEVVLFPVDRV